MANSKQQTRLDAQRKTGPCAEQPANTPPARHKKPTHLISPLTPPPLPLLLLLRLPSGCLSTSPVPSSTPSPNSSPATAPNLAPPHPRPLKMDDNCLHAGKLRMPSRPSEMRSSTTAATLRSQRLPSSSIYRVRGMGGGGGQAKPSVGKGSVERRCAAGESRWWKLLR